LVTAAFAAAVNPRLEIATPRAKAPCIPLVMITPLARHSPAKPSSIGGRAGLVLSCGANLLFF
jgi:hypothetical protein